MRPSREGPYKHYKTALEMAQVRSYMTNLVEGEAVSNVSLNHVRGLGYVFQKHSMKVSAMAVGGRSPGTHDRRPSVFRFPVQYASMSNF